jgi:ABC-2 type transport system ATP-binding protein
MTISDRRIHAGGVRKAFGDRTVLAGIDLDILPGEVLGLIGPNGAGKTTLMSCLLGFLHIDDGEIAFDGRRNADLAIRARTGFVPERMNLGRRITGRRFVRYMARLAGVPRATVDQRITTMLERLGLADAADRPMSQYSRGMLQRAAICQALVHEPDYLFLDEPASGLDPNGVLLVRDLIAEQKRRGAMVLLSSHQLSEVEKVCDRVVYLNRGVVARAEALRHADRIVMAARLLPGSFDPESVQRMVGSAPENDVVIITGRDDAEIAAAVRRLVTSGAEVVEVRPHVTDLESMFRGQA